MSIHKFRTAMVVELEVEFEYQPASGPYHDQPYYPAEVHIVEAKALPPHEGSMEWVDLEEECHDYIAGLCRDAEEEAADRGDWAYHRRRDERGA
jgi:hypothetical protein